MSDVPIARLLIVDDEAAQMRALCNTLRDQGYETHGYTSGKAALDALRSAEFDLLLTDLMMPEMDGLAVLRSALEKDPRIVGIMMTGEGSIASAVEAMKAGALDYVLKPFKLSAILPVLSRALAVRALRCQNAELQQRVLQHAAELEKANKELDAFASSVAHDLHAPARHIAAFAQILLEECANDLGPKSQRHLKIIGAAAERMGQLISDLLAFSRLARSEMFRRPVNFNTVINRVREDLAVETAGREIVWHVADLPAVQGDESMLRQVWQNLIGNAVKYSRGRNPAIIEIGHGLDDRGEPYYFVRDNGAGFNMEYVDQLFGVFRRLHRLEEFEGTGIGLANVRRIVQRHGGRTWATGEVDRGATFYFSLPR